MYGNTLRIPYTSRDFPSGTIAPSGDLQTGWGDLLWAALAVSPARVRSRISSRSNSASAAKIPNTRRPAAVVVSICAPCPVSTRRPTPRVDRSCMMLTRWTSVRLRRARFQRLGAVYFRDAGVADQHVSQTAVCDTRAKAPAGEHLSVSYPMSDSMSCIRRARVSRPRRRPASRVAAQILDQVPPARAADASREYAICGDDERLLPSSQRKVQAVVDRAAAVGPLHCLGLSPLDPLAATARTAPVTAGESSAPRQPGWCALDANGRTALVSPRRTWPLVAMSPLPALPSVHRHARTAASSPSSGCSARATTASVSAGLATTSEVGSFPVVPVNAQQARLEVLLWVP